MVTSPQVFNKQSLIFPRLLSIMSSTICYRRGSGVSLGQGCSGNFGDSSQIHNPSYSPSLTSSRGEYLRVVGIHSDG